MGSGFYTLGMRTFRNVGHIGMLSKKKVNLKNTKQAPQNNC